MPDLWKLENEIYDSGVSLLCGVDEAGRGPLAGPVYAAAVILPRGLEIDGLNDSKKLTAARRDREVVLQPILPSQKPPRTWRGWPPTCRPCASRSVHTWRASFTTNWARC